VPLLVDPTRFEQVLVNLLNNAAKYTEENGKIQLSADREGADVVIRVKDDGMGIASSLLPRVFDLFVQGERTLDRAQGGLGIGLTLVKRLVEMHGGRVEAVSGGSGTGSEFVVRLPVAPDGGDEALDGAADRRIGLDPHAPRSQRVLIVEDNIDAASMLTDLVERWGHDVRAVHEGEAALRAARAFHPEGVLVDIGLPGMDGYEVARRLRNGRDPGRANGSPLLIAISGYGRDADRATGLEAGFEHYLVKPPDPDVLRDLLERRPSNRSAL
jgi:CheY-like chemotaxis protein